MALSLKRQPKEDTGEKPKRERAPKKVKAVDTKKSRARRFVLIIGDEGSILIFMHGRKVVRRLFAPSPQPSQPRKHRRRPERRPRSARSASGE